MASTTATSATLRGSVRTTEDGWKFYGKFSYPGGPVLFKIEGGLNRPIKDLFVPHAELFNAREGSFSYNGEIGPQYLSLRSTTMPEVIIVGKLADSTSPVKVAGWLQVVEIPAE